MVKQKIMPYIFPHRDLHMEDWPRPTHPCWCRSSEPDIGIKNPHRRLTDGRGCNHTWDPGENCNLANHRLVELRQATEPGEAIIIYGCVVLNHCWGGLFCSNRKLGCSPTKEVARECCLRWGYLGSRYRSPSQGCRRHQVSLGKRKEKPTETAEWLILCVDLVRPCCLYAPLFVLTSVWMLLCRYFVYGIKIAVAQR